MQEVFLTVQGRREMKKNSKQGNPWENMNEKIDDVLGEKFWKDVLPVIPKRVPLIDIYETPTHGYMVLELPGLNSSKDVELSVQNNQLFIKGTIPYPYLIWIIDNVRIGGSMIVCAYYHPKTHICLLVSSPV
jgi:HSP20 family molecular chaperone IbpA